jgi:hypothetical protein
VAHEPGNNQKNFFLGVLGCQGMACVGASTRYLSPTVRETVKKRDSWFEQPGVRHGKDQILVQLTNSTRLPT